MKPLKSCVTLLSSPIADGFRMPAEWERHQRCWMGFPSRFDTWRDHASHAQKAFVEVATAISQFEPVTMCCPPTLLDKCKSMCTPKITIVPLEQDDAWFRDTGPTFVKKDGELRGVDWKFNAWGGLQGGCYADWEKDKLVASGILSLSDCARYAPDLILEGGSIHTDGEGTILTTAECLLNPNRNPNLSQSEIESRVLSFTGCRKMIWIPNGLFGDVDTNGHVDNLCCFVRPSEVMLCWTDDESDPQYEISHRAESVLLGTSDAKGRPLRVHRMPIPTTLVRTREEAEGVENSCGAMPRECGRLPASYVNFYLANGGIVAPSFDPESDERARKVFREVFPDLDVVMVPGREILLGGGNIHCITQQMPLSSVGFAATQRGGEGGVDRRLFHPSLPVMLVSLLWDVPGKRLSWDGREALRHVVVDDGACLCNPVLQEKRRRNDRIPRGGGA